jgi:dihydrofolate reductase
MRKIIVISMLTLDGVMQSPGSADEDDSGGFKYGGWSFPFGDEISDKVMKKLMEPADLLLGRKTFQIWENYWPDHASYWSSINTVTKYVMSTSINKSNWKNSVFINSIEDIHKLKKSNGTDIKVWGSGKLIQVLLKNDLVDELWLLMYPLTLGEGKKLFVDGAIPAAFTVEESLVTPSGLIITNFKRAGDVKTGTIGVTSINVNSTL